MNDRNTNFVLLLEYDLGIEAICPIGHSDLGLLFAVKSVTFTVARTASELLANCLQTENDVTLISPLGGVAYFSCQSKYIDS